MKKFSVEKDGWHVENITKGKTYEEIYGNEIAKTLRQRNNK